MSHFSINFCAKITPYEKINDEFTHCKCYVMALGKNRNLSHISREAADAAMKTLFNIPVVGNLYVDEDGNYHMGGHDYVLSEHDGQYLLKSVCVPYGVVPVQDNVTYEDVVEPNGSVHQYLVCDVILWTGRYPELEEAIYNKDIYFGQSMEINVSESAPLSEDTNYTDILEYSYSALCLLGKSDDPDYHVEPCFPMARVEAYTYSIDDNFLKLMEEFKSNLAVCFEKNTEKGGNSMGDLEVTNATVSYIEPEMTTITTATADNFTVSTGKVQTESYDAVTGDNNEVDAEIQSDATMEEVSGSDTASETVTMSEMSDAWTYNEMRDAIDAALPREEDDYVWLCDFDDNYAYVMIYVSDSHEPKYGRYTYTLDAANKVAIVTGEFEEMFVKWLTHDELVSLEQLRSQYEALCEYKNQREKTDREAAFDAVISEFDDLTAHEEFSAIVENRYSFDSADALRKECFALRGMINAPVARKTNIEPVIPVNEDKKQGSSRDEFFAAYGVRRK